MVTAVCGAVCGAVAVLVVQAVMRRWEAGMRRRMRAEVTLAYLDGGAPEVKVEDDAGMVVLEPLPEYRDPRGLA
jgi:hypothetical protein